MRTKYCWTLSWRNMSASRTLMESSQQVAGKKKIKTYHLSFRSTVQVKSLHILLSGMNVNNDKRIICNGYQKQHFDLKWIFSTSDWFKITNMYVHPYWYLVKCAVAEKFWSHQQPSDFQLEIWQPFLTGMVEPI